jgi:hypothetical protein
MPDGIMCKAPPLRDGVFCFFHDPAHAAEAQEVHRLGGLRRKREATVAGVYDFEGLGTTGHIRRLLDVAAFEVLGLDNSIARVRAIVAVVQAAAKLLETTELEERLKTLEAAVLSQRRAPESPFDQEPPTAFVGNGEGLL